jgi:hypothetical protein
MITATMAEEATPKPAQWKGLRHIPYRQVSL